MSISLGMLPSEFIERATLEDYIYLIAYCSFEPLPTNKIDVSQAAITTAIQGLFNKTSIYDNLNPWFKERRKNKELTEEEKLTAQVRTIMMFPFSGDRFDKDGKPYDYETRFNIIKNKLLEAKNKELEKRWPMKH